MSFAAFTPRIRWLNGRLVLARRIENNRFSRIEMYSSRNVLHAFRLTDPDEVDKGSAPGWPDAPPLRKPAAP